MYAPLEPRWSPVP